MDGYFGCYPTTVCITSNIRAMQVRMKRRFRNGVLLSDTEFGEQEWARGMLQLDRGTLYLLEGTLGYGMPHLGVLHRPTLKGVWSDTISFSGFEEAGGQWFAQTWFCDQWGP